MKKEMDTIQFEFKYEVSEVMFALEKVPEEEKNESVKTLINMLKVMRMEW